MKKAEEFRSQLSTVAFLATVLVVMCHVDDKFCGDSFVVKFLGGVFSDANVANFFFLSGYFLTKKVGHRGGYLNALVKRIRTLLVPLVAWSLITAAIYEVASRCGVVSGSINIWNLVDMFGLKNVSPEHVFGPLDFPLWYIETLMLFVVVSPVVLLLVKNFRNCGWLLPIVIVNLGWLQNLFGFSILPYSVLGIRFHSVGFACFAAGAYVSISNQAEKFCFRTEGSDLWKALWWLVAWVGVALVMVMSSRLMQHAHPYYVFFSVFVSIGLWPT